MRFLLIEKKGNSGVTGQDKGSDENSGKLIAESYQYISGMYFERSLTSFVSFPEECTKVTRKVLADLSNLGGNTSRPTLPGNHTV